MSDLCGIEKHLTYHCGRHTFVTTFLSLGIPIKPVSKMLEYTKIQTTQIYARITNNKIANEMNAIAGKLKTYESKSAIV
ncbi:tyrosine-type recombinase/integrase [Dysgonomonas gadei]|uniref:tyrosine-type recombinase/integrase n=1 Tax=Dysgonomonas gadei TaxID=156974 RepID=UPI0037BE7BC7